MKMLEATDDQLFSLTAGQMLLWYYVVKGTLHGPFGSRGSAYASMKDEQMQRYPRTAGGVA